MIAILMIHSITMMGSSFPNNMQMTGYTVVIDGLPTYQEWKILDSH